ASTRLALYRRSGAGPVSSRSSRSAACSGRSPGSTEPWTVSHAPALRPPGPRHSTSTSGRWGSPRSTYASMKRTRASMGGGPLVPAAAEHRLEPRRKGARAERLGEKVVGAELKHADFVVLVALRREDDDGDPRGRRPGAQMGEHAVPVEAGEVQVEDDDVGPHAV